MDTIILENPELTMLKNNKDSGFLYRQRREENWKLNYELYRDKVIPNRLIQRQTVNLPLMKQTIRTLLKDVDQMPILYFENLDNDKQKELFQNEYWKKTVEYNQMEIKDVVDKKQDMLFGRTFEQMQIADGRVKMTIEDPEDIVVDRFMDPTNIDSARFLIHTHIFVPFSVLEKNPDYDKAAVKALKDFYGTTEGIIKAQDNYDTLMKKNEKMADMGVTDVNDPVLGETYVELSLHFVMRGDDKNVETEEQYYLYVEADDQQILQKERLEKIIGLTTDHFWRKHLPYNTWAEDVDKQDFWTDGIADIVRVPNIVLNSWFSQLVENRTLRNFGMHYYDSSLKAEGFLPGTFNPTPWGWYPVPGKPSDVLQKVDIPDLSESIDEMEYVVKMVESSTGATPGQQGMLPPAGTPLGQFQLALGEAKQRSQGMSKFYTQCWKERGLKFLKLIEAAPDKLDAVKIFKKGRNTDNLYPRTIEPNDWMTKSGYNVKVWSQEEKKTQDTQALEKLNMVKSNMPDNPKLNEIYIRKLLEFADLTPDETLEIMDYEKKKMAMLASGVMNNNPMQPVQPNPGMPVVPAVQTQPQPPVQRQPVQNQSR